MSFPDDLDEMSPDPSPSGEPSDPAANESEPAETFVRSFSKDRPALGRSSGKSFHHPLASEPEDASTSDPESEFELPPNDDSMVVEFPPSPSRTMEFTSEPSSAAGDLDSLSSRVDEIVEDDLPDDSPWPENDREDSLAKEDIEANESFSAPSDEVFERFAGWEDSQQKATAYRWVIRIFFVVILAILAFLTYRKLTSKPGDRGKRGKTILLEELRGYRFALPNEQWKSVNKRPGSDVTLERDNPAAQLWIESGSRDSPIPFGKLADETRATWRADAIGWTEEASARSFVDGQEAYSLTARGGHGQMERKRSAQGLWHQGFWYRISFEASAADYDAVATECQAAIDEHFRFLSVRRGKDDSESSSPTIFHGIEFVYSIASPGSDWLEDSEWTADSRFADLKLRNARRTASLIVSPRAGATIDQLHDLYLRRQQKLFAEAITVERDEPLRIADGPARRLQASIQEDGFISRVFVAYFLQGDGIAYQLEAEVSADAAAEILPTLALAVQTFQVGPATPAESGDRQTADDGRGDNHFREAPDWVRPK